MSCCAGLVSCRAYMRYDLYPCLIRFHSFFFFFFFFSFIFSLLLLHCTCTLSHTDIHFTYIQPCFFSMLLHPRSHDSNVQSSGGYRSISLVNTVFL